MSRIISRRTALARLGVGCTVDNPPGLSSERSTVQTVTGPIPSSRLGVTLMHEHIVTDLRAPEQRRAGDYDREEVPAQPVNATPVLSRSARTRQPQSRQVVSGSGVQPRNSL